MDQEVSDLTGLQPEDLEAIEVLRLSSVNSHLCSCHLTDITINLFSVVWLVAFNCNGQRQCCVYQNKYKWGLKSWFKLEWCLHTSVNLNQRNIYQMKLLSNSVQKFKLLLLLRCQRQTSSDGDHQSLIWGKYFADTNSRMIEVLKLKVPNISNKGKNKNPASNQKQSMIMISKSYHSRP